MDRPDAAAPVPLLRARPATLGRDPRWTTLLSSLGALHRREARRPRDGAPAWVALLPDALQPEAHTALLAWLCDPRGEHHLGTRGLREVLGLVGMAPALAEGVASVGVAGGCVRVSGLGLRLHLALRRGDGTMAPEADAAVDADGLVRVLAVLCDEMAPEARGLAAGWTASLRRAMLPADAMADSQSFSPDARFVLQHWHDFQALRAAHAKAEAEFVALRGWIFAQVVARFRAEDGWVCLLEEDWILVRRARWPVPAEEWLALVVVLSDLDAVLGGVPGEGWFAAVSLPTDGDFEDENFTAQLRARVDPVAWRAYLSPVWPGYALGRALPPPAVGAEVSTAVAHQVMSELEALAGLVRVIDAVLAGMSDAAGR